MTNILTKYDKEELFREFQEFTEFKKFLESKEKGETIPTSIFSNELSPFESVVKYLSENLGKSYSEIGRLLKKDRRVVWTTYKRASTKSPGNFSAESEHSIPLKAITSGDASLAELITGALKAKGLSNSQVSSILKKDQRTIWTLYDRYKKKCKN